MAWWLCRALGLEMLVAIAGVVGVNAANAQTPIPLEDPALDKVTSPTLVRFESTAAYQAYVEQLDDITSAADWDTTTPDWGESQRRPNAPQRFAMVRPQTPSCLAGPYCLSDSIAAMTHAGGAASWSIPYRRAVSNGRNQTKGVGQGDIALGRGPFVLVLRDNSLISIDTRDGLRIADRINIVDQSDRIDYSKILSTDRHVIVTAFDRRRDSAIISIFNIERDSGKFIQQGKFLITSQDKNYSHSLPNYDTRIVDNKLIIYTSFEFDSFDDQDTLPTLRGWSTGAEQDGSKNMGHALIDARDIYRPVQRTPEPTIHGIAICEIGNWKSGDMLSCKTTAFAAPDTAQWFVSRNAVYLWTWADDNETGRLEACETAPRPLRRQVVPSVIFRLPINGGEPTAISVNGAPYDQFSIDEQNGEFRALASWRPYRCADAEIFPRYSVLLRISAQLFGNRIAPLRNRWITQLPETSTAFVDSRFIGNWLVYGAYANRMGSPLAQRAPAAERRPNWNTDQEAAYWRERKTNRRPQVIAVPVDRPSEMSVIDLPHTMIGMERVGDDVLISGYRDRETLSLSFLKLNNHRAHIRSTLRLNGRLESQAPLSVYDNFVRAEGDGLIGVPTARRDDGDRGYEWMSRSPELSFISLSRDGVLTDNGPSIRSSERSREDLADPDCKPICESWNDVARPIFNDGRIFGLVNSDLVEGQIINGELKAGRRIDLRLPPGSIAVAQSTKNAPRHRSAEAAID